MNLEIDQDWAAVGKLTADLLTGSADPWGELVAAGIPGIAVPTEHGGQGLGVGAVLTALTEVGRAGATMPALSTLAYGVLPVAALASTQQCAELLTGDCALTAALHEPGEPFPARPSTRLRDGALHGVKTAVANLDTVRTVLVPASEPDGVGVYLVDPTAPGVSVSAGYASGSGPEFTLRLDNVRADRLPGVDAVATLYSLAKAGILALAEGVLAGTLALTSSHVASREQFGRPLASFQAVAGQIGDVYIAARTLHLIALSVAWRLAEGKDAGEDLDIGMFWLTEELLPAMHTCHHLHGGLGVDISYPLPRYYALAKDLTRWAGGGDAARTALGDRLAVSGAH